MINGLKPLTIFGKSFIVDDWHVSGYTIITHKKCWFYYSQNKSHIILRTILFYFLHFYSHFFFFFFAISCYIQKMCYLFTLILIINYIRSPFLHLFGLTVQGSVAKHLDQWTTSKLFDGKHNQNCIWNAVGHIHDGTFFQKQSTAFSRLTIFAKKFCCRCPTEF